MFYSLCNDTMIIFFVYSAVFGCALWRKLLARESQVRSRWPYPEDFFLGFCFATFSCLFSRVLFQWDVPGILLVDSLSIVATWYWFRQKPIGSKWISNVPVVVLKLLFVGAVAALFFPLLTGQSLRYRLPDIFDLPKHLSALAAVANSESWPLPNPFYPVAPFAYNAGFYLVPGIIAKYCHGGEAIPIVMAAATILVTWHTLGLAQRLMQRLSIPRKFHFWGLLLLTFAGGITPLFVSHKPPIAFILCLEKLSPRWIDDPFVSFIYVPQHILGVGLILTAWLFCTSRLPLLPKLGAQALLIGGSVITSFILIPLALVSLMAFFIWELFRCLYKTREKDRCLRVLASFGVVTFGFIILTGPFLWQIRNWAGSYGKPSFIVPNLTLKNWFYTVASTGVVVPLALVSLFRIRQKKRRYLNSRTVSYALLLLLGTLFFLFVEYPESWTKLGLFLRIGIVPVAALGLFFLWGEAPTILRSPRRWLLISILMAVAAVNFLIIRPLVSSAYIKRDPNEAKLIKVLRDVPANQNILLAVSYQELCALVGRPVYMDFKSVRADRYLPINAWDEAEKFFSQALKSSPLNADRGINLVLAPSGSPEAILCEKNFERAEPIVSSWSFFRVRQTTHPASTKAIGNSVEFLFPFSLFCAFFLRAVLVVCVAVIIRQFCRSMLEAIIGSWTVVQLGSIVIMAVLSIPRWLTGSMYWFALMTATIASLYTLRHSKSRQTVEISGCSSETLWKSPANVIAFCGLAVLLIGLTCRSIYFFDTTWDGLVYELPRVSFFASHQSILVNEPTIMRNLFSNEWNGELNALHYVLLTGSDQASGFGSVEFWLFAVLALTWFAGVLDIPKGWRLMAVLLVVSTPLILGLAMVVKGDILACAAVMAALCWMVRLGHSDGNGWYVFFALSTVGLATGAKIVTMPLGIGMTAMVFWLVWQNRYKLEYFYGLSAGFVVWSIGNLRYALNIFQFKDPFFRLSSEHSIWAISNLSSNLMGIYKSLFDCIFKWPFKDGYVFWALGVGLGFLGVGINLSWVIVLGRSIKKRTSHNQNDISRVAISRTSMSLAILLVLSFLHLLLVMHWFPWSFRYFSVWIIVFLLISLKGLFTRFNPGKVIAIGCCSAVIAANTAITWQYSEVRPNTFGRAKSYSQLERKFALYNLFYDEFLRHDDKLISLLTSDNTQVLLYQGPNACIYPFFGNNHQAQVQLVNSLRALLPQVPLHSFDLIVIAGKPVPEHEQPIIDELHKLGYTIHLSNSWWRIFLPVKESDSVLLDHRQSDGLGSRDD